jgi:hypothetical protein
VAILDPSGGAQQAAAPQAPELEGVLNARVVYEIIRQAQKKA